MFDDNSIHDYLKRYFGFDTFKGNQEEIIKSVLSGSDTFVLKRVFSAAVTRLCLCLPAEASHSATSSPL